ncbi:MAG TPA: macro domain-containing protein [Pirellulales bacterium]|jgi:O-acetyl-ADP-ribose deacetylase (regulator of RNase III)|nr:macro domain-containing protein [Pirellulales bacterium]
MDIAERMRVDEADITSLAVAAIVNAANDALLPGGGVCGAIHAAAGPGLAEECRKIGGCPTGEARITSGYLLPASYVIHAVGPIWDGGDMGEPELLAKCYRSALEIAADKRLADIALPCISTGIFGYPKPEACKIAVATVSQWLRDNGFPERVIFCCFSAADAARYRAELAGIA